MDDASCTHYGRVSRLCMTCTALKHTSSKRVEAQRYIWLRLWCEVKCSVSLSPDVTERRPSKKFHFCLISPQKLLPKVLVIVKIHWQTWDGSLSSFWWFCFVLSHWCQFFPSLFLLVWGKWGLQFSCYTGFFWDLLDRSLLRSWCNFGEPATLGSVHHCLMFVNNDSPWLWFSAVPKPV